MRQKKKKSKILKQYSNKITAVLSSSKTALNYKQICMRLGVHDPKSRADVISCLQFLLIDTVITEEMRGKFKLHNTTKYHAGIFNSTSRGSGYVRVEYIEQEIFIPKHKTQKALDGDEVQFYIHKRKRNGRVEGEIVQVVKRAKSEFVGVIQINKNYAFVVPDNSKIPVDIYIPLKHTKDAEEGQKVLVKIQDWPDKADCPIGKVIEVLGNPGDHQTEIHAILADYGLPNKFPQKIEDYANSLDTTIQSDEINKRKDIRQVLTFTIDPKDAKDFDDALSFKVLENGNYEVGIHIADVSYYVKEGTILDDEAYDRATSIYLVDRVVPMLPECLSNHACSLRPQEEKYTFSAMFEINATGKIYNQWFGRTVIYSDARFSYEEAQHIIETQSTQIPQHISLTNKSYNTSESIKHAILELNNIARILRSDRMKNGAISFDKLEVKFNLDSENNPKEVYFKTSKDANKLIEEFMLLANRSVAEFIGKQKPSKTFIYRVHDVPDQQKLESLQRIIHQFGYKLNLKTPKDTSSSLNQLLLDVVGTKAQNLVDTLAIRSMSKAEYTTQNIGHYGLSFDYYSHFTSPIRRYPDIMAHRLLQHYLDGNTTQQQNTFEEKCKHASKMENLATKAERDSIKYMQIKYMQNNKETQFSGVISGVTEWGIYVEITENKCEGMVRIKDLKEDYFTFDSENYSLVGEQTNKRYQLGDQVLVKVKKADLIQRHLDFTII